MRLPIDTRRLQFLAVASAEPVPAAEAAGLSRTRPYDLRRSAASLWPHEGRTIIEVATWMAHSGQMASRRTSTS